jgi:hypothetical protein
MQLTKSRFLPRGSQILRSAVVVGAMVLSLPATGMVINPTFTAAFNTSFGANAAAAQAAWIAAATVFTSNFSDPITVNIAVDGVTGTGVFGHSNTGLIGFTTNGWSNMQAKLVADSKTADDATATGAGGSLAGADPTGGAAIWATRSEAKALGIIASDGANDGTTTFGSGFNWSFNSTATGSQYDFQGVADHEISEVLGRLGLGGQQINVGGTNFTSYSVVDLFSYRSAGVRVLGNGGAAGQEGSFSINGGTTLLMQYNDQFSNALDYRDWNTTTPYTPDSFNQFSNNGVANPVSNVDLKELDVIGYDRIIQTTGTPEPSTGIVLFASLLLGGFVRRRVLSQK